jgi:cytochrome oxidase Cu insertion factor (SCO1/SenC/PrrC family)
MGPRFPLLVVLVTLVLALGACGGDPQPDPGPAAPATTADPGPDTTAVAAPTTQTTWPLPKGVVPAGRREPAPDLQVTDFDGRTVTLGGFRGQPVVVNFFESW